MNSDYSKREIDLLIKRIDEKLDFILVQTTKTNGNVAEAHYELDKIREWQSYTNGALKIISVIIISILIPFVLLMVKELFR